MNKKFLRAQELVKRLGKYGIVCVFGTGKIIASAALMQLGLQKTLAAIGLSEEEIWVVSISAAGANAFTNGVTRYPAISAKVFSKPGLVPSDFKPGHGSVLFFLHDQDLSFMQKTLAWLVKILGRGSLCFMAINTQSAVQKAIAYYADDKDSPNAWFYIVPAAFVTLSSSLCYAAFNLRRVDRNADAFARFLTTGLVKNLLQYPFKILLPLTIMTVLNVLPNMGTNYFVTKDALATLFGSEISSKWYMQALLYGSLVCGFSTNLFTLIGEAFRFLTKQGQFRRWVGQNWITTSLLLMSLLPILLDIGANILSNYAGNIELAGDLPRVNRSAVWVIAFASICAAIYGAFYATYQEVPVLDEIVSATKGVGSILPITRCCLHSCSDPKLTPPSEESARILPSPLP